MMERIPDPQPISADKDEPATAPQTVVLVGLESVGKSAIFRGLTGRATGDETNVRGSTVDVRSGTVPTNAAGHATLRVIDTPGIRAGSDSETTRLTRQQLAAGDVVALVVRGTHARAELDTLLAELGESLAAQPVLVILTFEDRAAPEMQQMAGAWTQGLGVPVVLVNARTMAAAQRAQLLTGVAHAAPLRTLALPSPPPDAPNPVLPSASVVDPQRTPFENPRWGPWLALVAVALLFGLPVYLSYLLADFLQPPVDRLVIEPLVTALSPLAVLPTVGPLLVAVLVGDYGLLTLGWYSFLWAFPVVVLMGLSVALAEETGLKDRVTAALDPWLQRIGLNGRDLVPVLGGFGCNVVAVFQTRSCSHSTRGACVSMIAFGSACSYQIGASLSLFNTAGASWLFAPYLLLLFGAGATHTRLWHGAPAEPAIRSLAERAFLQRPSLRGVWWRTRSVLAQFLQQAMPIFLAICVVGALLQQVGLLEWLAGALSPFMGWLGLPGEAAPGVLFSIVRKDGLLVLNEGRGALLQGMSAGQVFVLVYLASTLTACLVTLWTVRGELGARTALRLAARQALTALVSTAAIAGGIRIFTGL